MNLAQDQTSTVLLVDDDHDVLAAHARYLRINDINVIVSDRVEVALQRLTDHQIDVVITDLRMPDMDGLDFIKEVRKTQPLMPVLFFSGYAQVNDVVEAMKLGAADFLEKPVSPEELLSSLHYILSMNDPAVAERHAFCLDQSLPFKNRVHLYEKHLIESCLQKHTGNIAEVLKELNINRRTLNDKMHKLGIQRKRNNQQ